MCIVTEYLALYLKLYQMCQISELTLANRAIKLAANWWPAAPGIQQSFIILKVTAENHD